ncbi:MAG: RNA polymerase sigma factor [Patescibacteria group bacterium]
MQRFEQLVAQYQRTMVNFHFRFVGDKFQAEDLAQDTFLKAYKKFHTLKDPDKVKSWLMAVARNVVIDFYRRNKDKTVVLDESLHVTHPEATTVDYQDQISQAELSRQLAQCIDRLVKEDRAIVRLLYYEGFSYQEIGELLGINQNTLKSRLHRARKALLGVIKSDRALADAAMEYGSTHP